MSSFEKMDWRDWQEIEDAEYEAHQKEIEDSYQLGFSEGYSKAETDYFARTEKDRQDCYNFGYQKGRADAIDAFVTVLLSDMTFINPTKEQIRRIAEQIKEQSNVEMDNR